MFLASGVVSLVAQQDSVYQTFDYTKRAKYNIDEIQIEGAVNRDRNAIKSIAGLREGEQITIPGDDIPNAIKSLLRLRLFEDVQVYATKIEGDLISLKLVLVEQPTLSRYSIKGEKKSKHSSLTEIIDKTLTKGSIVTQDLKDLATQKLEEYYIGKGFLDAKVTIDEVDDELKANAVRLVFNVDKKERVKIAHISILGNVHVSDDKIKRKMKDTKEKGTLLKKSKFVREDFKVDKNNIIDFYNKNGYRDAVILSDSIWRSYDGELYMELKLYEGKQYYFRTIRWKGNSKYSDEQLSNVLGIQKGAVYDPELLERRLSFSMDGRDVSSLYLDDGYLFFTVDPVEVAIFNDSIDMEMQIFEGAQATISSVGISGNDRTHEHVVRRELRTKPGDKFSRSNIIRSQRALMNLGYFNPETMDIQTPVNQQNGTVEVNYKLEERPSDQLELSAGYGGIQGGLIGTLGVTFNNFSIGNIKDRSTWSPLPQGDGQKLSIRAQSNSRFFRSYNLSFTEPWLGGKRPTSFTLGAVHSAFDQQFFGLGSLKITRFFTGLGTQLRWPDDFFSLGGTLTLETINLDEYAAGGFFVDNVRVVNGNFKNFSFTTTITRSSVSEPIFPRSGSRISLSIQATPPYSLFRNNNYWVLNEGEIADLEEAIIRDRGPGSVYNLAQEVQQEEISRRFEFLEYHKWVLKGEWYYNLFSKVVLAANVKFGFLGTYNNDIGISPFERFELGGDGLSNQNVGIVGRDIISMRGYEVAEFDVNTRGGGAVYNKLTMELRYPLSLNPNSSIYVHGFVQGGNAWSSFREFNPYDMRRSAGFGLRVFLPMFGLLGFDYGLGFDKDPNAPGFEGYGQFNIVLGFEPE
jgi:outer membrane protein insertion porin family